jgi:UDP:flavonoid glycosyltransferase YjiC (YdhE family)
MGGRVVLCTGGSHGDVHPFIALALEHKAIGLDPIIATSERYRSKIEAEGLQFHRVRPDYDGVGRELGLDLPQIVQRMTDDPVSHVRDFIIPFLREAYTDTLEVLEGADFAVVNHVSLGARLAVEKRDLPHVAVVLQPTLFFSSYDPPKFIGVPFALPPRSHIGVTWNRLLLWVISLTGPAPYTRPLREFRREVGLGEAKRSMIFDADPEALWTLGLYSPQMGSAQLDFPAKSSVVGFSFYDREDPSEAADDLDLEDFLAAGPPPLVFSLGTFAIHASGEFYQQSVHAARRLGMRAVLLASKEEVARLTPQLSPEIKAYCYVPHSRLFPRAAAIIHHGGMGTAAQALRAGKPQLVVPFLFEQPDNAHRLRRLGVARSIDHRSYTAERAATEIQKLLNDPHILRQTTQVADGIAQENGGREAVRIISQFLR